MIELILNTLGFCRKRLRQGVVRDVERQQLRQEQNMQQVTNREDRRDENAMPPSVADNKIN